MTSPLSRRRAITGAASVGIGAPLLAACSGDEGAAATDPTSPSATATPTTSSSGVGTATATTAAGASGGGLVATADVPVGGGVVLSEEELVVTQPTDGTFEAFTAICTHQGCLVGSVSDGAITCPCHNSTFSVEDGSVLGGPATGPLASVAVEVVDGQVVRA